MNLVKFIFELISVCINFTIFYFLCVGFWFGLELKINNESIIELYGIKRFFNKKEERESK